MDEPDDAELRERFAKFCACLVFLHLQDSEPSRENVPRCEPSLSAALSGAVASFAASLNDILEGKGSREGRPGAGVGTVTWTAQQGVMCRVTCTRKVEYIALAGASGGYSGAKFEFRHVHRIDVGDLGETDERAGLKLTVEAAHAAMMAQARDEQAEAVRVWNVEVKDDPRRGAGECSSPELSENGEWVSDSEESAYEFTPYLADPANVGVGRWCGGDGWLSFPYVSVFEARFFATGNFGNVSLASLVYDDKFSAAVVRGLGR